MADDSGIGAIDETVVLELDGKECKVTESYDVNLSVMTVPSHFAVSMGWSQSAATLIKQDPGYDRSKSGYIPRTPFTISVGGHLVMTGLTDGFEVQGTGSGGTTVTVEGRDALAHFHDSQVTDEKTFKSGTLGAFVKDALKECGMESVPIVFDNTANREVMLGKKGGKGGKGGGGKVSLGGLTKSYGKRNLASILAGGAAGGGKGPSIVAHTGTTWFQVVFEQLERQGVFLWAAADGSLVMGEPDLAQDPSYAITRGSTTSDPALSGVLSYRFKNNAASRYFSCHVFGRAGAPKWGPQCTHEGVIDPEMEAWGFTKKMGVRDSAVKNREQAGWLGWKRLAEVRRRGWQLEYTVSGHTTKQTPSGQPSVWVPDTLVQVDDTELGISGAFWLESVHMKRDEGSGTTTTLTLLRPGDLYYFEQ